MEGTLVPLLSELVFVDDDRNDHIEHHKVRHHLSISADTNEISVALPFEAREERKMWGQRVCVAAAGKVSPCMK